MTKTSSLIHFPFAAIAVLVGGCADSEQKATVADQVAAAHGIAHWHEQEVLTADLTLVMGENPPLRAEIAFQPNGSKTRLELENGVAVIYDGTDAYLSSPEAEFPPPDPRFHVLTWPWFMGMPFKINGSGTELTDFEEVNLNGKDYLTARQTFASGEGDSPDDWYQLYIDPKSKLLQMAAYIVTYGKSVEEAEKSPSAIVYQDYKDVEGAMIASKWRFHQFDLKKGMLEQKGSGSLANILFMDAGSVSFEPEGGGAKLDPPQS